MELYKTLKVWVCFKKTYSLFFYKYYIAPDIENVYILDDVESSDVQEVYAKELAKTNITSSEK